ncbi:hypothetical protein E9993_17020 [Labilibacter sediminis]|nr:hypothetical protein E9993_17020 [Labilibacter sediminis]
MKFQATDLYMAHEENKLWLKKVKEAEKNIQWEFISSRFFTPNEVEVNLEKNLIAAPLLIIDGIPMNMEVKRDKLKKIANLLSIDKVEEIKIIAEEPEELYINKAFTGIILVVLNDKKISKKYKRINSQ